MEHVRVRCTSCEAVYKVKAQLAGKKVKCPSCQQTLVVPAQAPFEGGEEPAPAMSQAEAAAQKPKSSYGVAGTPEAPRERTRRRATSDEADEEATSAARPARKTKSSRRARTAAWKKVRLGFLFLSIATTMTLTTGLCSFVLGHVLPSGALLVLHNLMYPGLLCSQPLQIGGFSLVLFVPARLPKRLTAGVLATCLGISVVGELLTLWAWVSFGSEDKSQQILGRLEEAMQKLQASDPDERAKAQEMLNQVNKEAMEESNKIMKKLGAYLTGTLLLYPVLLLSLGVNYLLFPFWLKALARILHVESLVEAYMDFYKVATALFVVSLVCVGLLLLGIPFWVRMFILLPLGFIAFLVSLGMQYAYLRLLTGFREEIAELT